MSDVGEAHQLRAAIVADSLRRPDLDEADDSTGDVSRADWLNRGGLWQREPRPFQELLGSWVGMGNPLDREPETAGLLDDLFGLPKLLAMAKRTHICADARNEQKMYVSICTCDGKCPRRVGNVDAAARASVGGMDDRTDSVEGGTNAAVAIELDVDLTVGNKVMVDRHNGASNVTDRSNWCHTVLHEPRQYCLAYWPIGSSD